MEVLIVSKTHMRNNACVGGLALSDNSYVRLLSIGGRNQPEDTEYEVGQVWDLDFSPRNLIQKPHVEDVVVRNGRFVRGIRNITRLIRGRNLIDWNGSIDNAFDGLLHWTNAGSGYIDTQGQLPGQSVGFWTSNRDLTRYEFMDNVRYRYPTKNGYKTLKFVGYRDTEATILAGAIIRLSLTRSFTTNGTTGYWLQLSGWY